MRASKGYVMVGALALLLQGCIIDLQQKQVVAADAGTTTPDGSADAEAVEEVQEDAAGQQTGPAGCAEAPDCAFLALGECASLKPTCDTETGTWSCPDPTALEHYETLESRCDGLDNDCNGLTDEMDFGGVPDAEACPAGDGDVGVCSLGLVPRCEGGAMTCGRDGIPGYEPKETLCDDVDNDCDGATDEDLMALPSVACPDGNFQGVCGAIGGIKCETGNWICDQDAYPVARYEAGAELSCDGLDNDCDGLTDEGISDLLQSDCPQIGVCQGKTVATCRTDGTATWDCDNTAIGNFEAVEFSCDGADNDCDGLTDEVAPQLAECDAGSLAKADKGVCKGQGMAVCFGTTVSCSFENVPNDEPIEVSCDGLDNDCNGATDDLADGTEAPSGTCSSLGECQAGVTAACENGGWSCSYTAGSFEAGNETLCDGKDNDCDGLTDENITGTATDCPGSGKGVCKDAPLKVDCQGGDWVCDYQFVNGYEAGAETSCDGKDNDCDGLIDENISGLAGSTCKSLGVCQTPGQVQATCSPDGSGTWDCDYTKLEVAGLYDGDLELQCDGKDNDCDGVIDEGIVVDDPDALETGCPNLGICAGQVQAFCINGGWECNPLQIVGFESPEKTCDTLDNNCDGVVDEGTCPDLAPCSTNSQCKSGICREGPDGETTFCVASGASCPTQGGGAQVGLGETSCFEQSDGGVPVYYISTCTSAGWDTAFGAPCESGACAAGACKKCVPGAVNCETSTEALLVCDQTGDNETPVPCPTDTNCIVGFHGVCLRHEDQKLDIQNAGDEQAQYPAITKGYEESPLIAFQAGGPDQFTAVGRRLDVSMTLQTTDYIIGKFGFSSYQHPSVAFWSPGKFATAYAFQQVTATDPGEVRVNIVGYNAAGQALSNTMKVNQTVPFEQGRPRVVRRTGAQAGITLVWHSQGQVNGFDIMTRSFDVKAKNSKWLVLPSKAFPDEALVNTTTTADQVEPSVAALSDGRLIVAWSDQLVSNTNTWGVVGRFLDKFGQPQGAELVLHQASPVAAKRDVEVAALNDGGFVAVWTRDVDGNQDVWMRLFDAAGAPTTDELLVSQQGNGLPKAGIQRTPDVAAVPGSGEFVVVWEDGASADPNGSGIVMRQYAADATPYVVRQVNQDGPAIVGDQLNPRVGVFANQGVPYAVIVYESADGNGVGVPAIFTRPMVLQ